jgi:diguanylate cyclase
MLLIALTAAARIIFVSLRLQRLALQEARRSEERLARVDPLTGLANRRAFDEDLTLEIARAHRNGTPLSLILGDIDRFKRINDRYGHERGDEYLRRLGGVLQENTRAGEQCFRWGGDEFALLLPGSDSSQAQSVCTRLAQAINSADSLTIESERSRVTLAIAELGESEQAADLLRKADRILLRRKGSASRNTPPCSDPDEDPLAVSGAPILEPS